jgi:uncharacterized membrane protein
MESIPPRRTTLRSWISNTLLSGLVVLVPLGLTVYVLKFMVETADSFFGFLPEWIWPQGEWRFPGSGLILAFVLTLVAGILARNFIGRFVGNTVVRVIARVPVVAGLYKLFRQISQTFLGGSGQGFQRVVLVEWPRREAWTLAFVTGEVSGARLAALGKEHDDGPWLSLFVPTTPNPTAGFYFLAKPRDVRDTRLSVEAAFKVIISAGALSPD